MAMLLVVAVVNSVVAGLEPDLMTMAMLTTAEGAAFWYQERFSGCDIRSTLRISMDFKKSKWAAALRRPKMAACWRL